MIFHRARKNLRPHIGDVDAAAIATGIGRAIGNKVICYNVVSVTLIGIYYQKENIYCLFGLQVETPRGYSSNFMLQKLISSIFYLALSLFNITKNHLCS